MLLIGFIAFFTSKKISSGGKVTLFFDIIIYDLSSDLTIDLAEIL